METPFTARLPGRALSLVTGPDSEAFLQGLLTCDVAGLAPGQARYGALLSPQGKILYDIILVKLEQGYLIDSAAMEREGLLKRLSFYKLRSKVDFLELEGGVVAGTGEAPPGAVMDPRTALLGWRQYGAARGGEAETYEAHRISLGIADSVADIGSGTLFPHEANLDQLHGVSFTKGCYVGQEVVSRTEHKAMARSRILIAEFAGAAPASGTILSADGQPVATVLSGHGKLALALARLDRLSEATHKPEGVTFRKAPWARYEFNG